MRGVPGALALAARALREPGPLRLEEPRAREGQTSSVADGERLHREIIRKTGSTGNDARLRAAGSIGIDDGIAGRQRSDAMDADQAARAFAQLFHRTFLRFHERQAPGERPLTFEAIAVLLHLESTGPLSIQESARHFGRSQAATSEIVARLVRKGLLVRFPDQRDRRRTLVWLSPAGIEALEKSHRILSLDALARAFAGMEEASRGELLSALEGLLETDPRSTARVEGEERDPDENSTEEDS